MKSLWRGGFLAFMFVTAAVRQLYPMQQVFGLTVNKVKASTVKQLTRSLNTLSISPKKHKTKQKKIPPLYYTTIKNMQTRPLPTEYSRGSFSYGALFVLGCYFVRELVDFYAQRDLCVTFYKEIFEKSTIENLGTRFNYEQYKKFKHGEIKLEDDIPVSDLAAKIRKSGSRAEFEQEESVNKRRVVLVDPCLSSQYGAVAIGQHLHTNDEGLVKNFLYYDLMMSALVTECSLVTPDQLMNMSDDDLGEYFLSFDFAMLASLIRGIVEKDTASSMRNKNSEERQTLLAQYLYGLCKLRACFVVRYEQSADKSEDIADDGLKKFEEHEKREIRLAECILAHGDVFYRMCQNFVKQLS